MQAQRFERTRPGMSPRPRGADGGRARRADVLVSTHGTGRERVVTARTQFRTDSRCRLCPEDNRRLGAEYEGVVAEAERAVGCVRVTMRQETSGLYAVAVGPADIDAGCVRHAHERSLLVGPGCAGDQHEADPATIANVFLI